MLNITEIMETKKLVMLRYAFGKTGFISKLRIDEEFGLNVKVTINDALNKYLIFYYEDEELMLENHGCDFPKVWIKVAMRYLEKKQEEN